MNTCFMLLKTLLICYCKFGNVCENLIFTNIHEFDRYQIHEYL